MKLARTTALIVCLAALLLGGCGSSNDKGKPIPAATRQELDKQLQSIENRFDAGGGACSDIAQNQSSVQTTIDALPSDVATDVRNGLRDGFDRLFQLTAEQCDEKKNQQTTPTETTPAPTPTETTPTAPTPTETTPTTPEQKPKDDNKGKGKGGGTGDGGGDSGGGNVVPQTGNGGGGGGTVSP
jgi:hypothetical protein